MTEITRAYTANHVIPKGVTYVRRLDESGAKILGSNQAFPLTIEVTALDHFSAESGFNEKDDTANVSRDFSSELPVEDIQDEWLANWLMGNYGAISDAGGAVTNEAHALILNSEIQLGRGVAPLTAAGARMISAVTIKHSATGAAGWITATVYAAGDYITEGLYIYKAPVGGTSAGTIPTFPTTIGGTVADTGGFEWVNVGLDTLVELTDYQVGSDLGRIKILSTAGVAAGESYLFDYTKAANTLQGAWSSDSDVEELEVEIIGTAVKGAKQNWLFPRVKLTPSGEMSLKSEEAAWQRMTFTMTVLKPTDGRESVYKNGAAVLD
jgi:hypothetical protein